MFNKILTSEADAKRLLCMSARALVISSDLKCVSAGVAVFGGRQVCPQKKQDKFPTKVTRRTLVILGTSSGEVGGQCCSVELNSSCAHVP